MFLKKVASISNSNHAFPLTEFVCESAQIRFGGSDGIMSTTRPELSPSLVSGRGFSEGVHNYGYI